MHSKKETPIHRVADISGVSWGEGGEKGEGEEGGEGEKRKGKEGEDGNDETEGMKRGQMRRGKGRGDQSSGRRDGCACCSDETLLNRVLFLLCVLLSL